ncbi:hypothetical protein BN871_JU_00040 [Paenibacillus sp. P22]|nr:hypothetical protein BN871_JU_00040 [Paenibacillus sp. P22]
MPDGYGSGRTPRWRHALLHLPAPSIPRARHIPRRDPVRDRLAAAAPEEAALPASSVLLISCFPIDDPPLLFLFPRRQLGQPERNPQQQQFQQEQKDDKSAECNHPALIVEVQQIRVCQELQDAASQIELAASGNGSRKLDSSGFLRQRQKALEQPIRHKRMQQRQALAVQMHAERYRSEASQRIRFQDQIRQRQESLNIGCRPCFAERFMARSESPERGSRHQAADEVRQNINGSEPDIDKDERKSPAETAQRSHQSGVDHGFASLLTRARTWASVRYRLNWIRFLSIRSVPSEACDRIVIHGLNTVGIPAAGSCSCH